LVETLQEQAADDEQHADEGHQMRAVAARAEDWLGQRGPGVGDDVASEARADHDESDPDEQRHGDMMPHVSQNVKEKLW